MSATLLDLNDRFTVIANSVPALIAYVDRNCTYRFVNRAYELWFGIDAADIIGRTVAQVVGPAAWQTISENVLAALGGELIRFETLIPYQTAGDRYVSVTFTPDKDSNGTVRGVVALIHDISQQRSTLAALRKEHHFNSTVLSTTAALIVVLDLQGHIVHLNRAFEKACGRSSSEVIGRRFFDLFIPEEERPAVLKVFEELGRGASPIRHVNSVCHRDGSARLIEWSNNALYSEAGVVEFVIGTGVDITEQRELERQLISISDAERERIGRELHDGIGQRLTALEMFVHLLKKDIQQQAPSLLGRCRQLSAELRGITREARLLSHGLAPVAIQADSLPLAIEQLAHNATAASGLNVRLVHADSTVLRAPDVPMHLYRIAQEALNNALKHSKARNIDLSLRRTDLDYTLEIRDDGQGFVTTQKSPGMGLRLMTHRAELIDAEISVLSQPGRGTTVRCKLPL